MRRRLRPRRGFTLIEVLVFVPLGLMVLGLVWAFFRSSAVKGKATDVKLQGLQANLVLAMHLERDLESLYEDDSYRMMIAENGSALRFHRCADTSPASEWDPLPLEEVQYRFDPALGRVMRRVGGGAEKPLYGYFELVHFRVETPPDEVPLDQELQPAASVVFTAVALPEEEIQKPYEERDPKKRTILVSGAGRRWVSSRVTYPFWNPIPYLPPTPAGADPG